MAFTAFVDFKTPTCAGVSFKGEKGNVHRLSGELNLKLIDDDSRMYFSGTYRYWLDNNPPMTLRVTGGALQMLIKNIIAAAAAENELVGSVLADCFEKWRVEAINHFKNDLMLVMG